MALYHRKRDSLPLPHESRFIDTRYGRTHVLIMGAAEAPPLVAIHGVNFGAPFMADMLRGLAADYRIFIPDIVGQPGLSDESRPQPGLHAYGAWLTDVLDGVGLERANMLGVSFGGAVLLDLAALAPQRVSKAVLIVPGGFAGADAHATRLLRLFLMWHAYRLLPGLIDIRTAVRPLAWVLDADQAAYFDAILRHVRWLIPPPGPFTKHDLQAFTAPVAIFAAAHDIFFPADDLLREARAVLPNLAASHVYDSSHLPTPEMMADTMTRASAFLAATT